MKLSKKVFLSGIFFFTLSIQNLASAKIEAVLGLPLEQNSNLAIKAPETDASEIILSREQYIISYNKDRRSPNWVAWKLEADQIGKSGRSNNFLIDTELDNYLSQNATNKHAVDAQDYKGSCFDRGHQVPSADRTDTLTNNETTFLMSNMIPQTPYLNRVVWEHLESYSRDLVLRQSKKLYTLAGPIYDQDLGSIGPQKDIPVPSKNFKIIFILDSNQTFQDINSSTPKIVVIMPNILQDGSLPNTNNQERCGTLKTDTTDKKDWMKYTTTIGEVERLSGIKFDSSKL